MSEYQHSGVIRPLKKLYNNINILIFISIITVLIYSFSIKGDFSNLDDMEYINSIKKLQGNYWKILDPDYDPKNYYHPLLHLSLALDYSIWNLNPAGFHFTNLLLFIFTLYILYFVLMKLYQNRYVSFMTVLLFAVHPIHVEVISWITCRAHLIGTILLFLSFYCFILFTVLDKKIYYFFSLILFILALLSQILIFILPVILYLYIYSFNEKDSLTVKFYRCMSILPYIIFVLIYFVFLASFDAYSRRMIYTVIPFYEKILTFIFIWGKSCMLILWPFNLSFIYPLSIQKSLYTLPLFYLILFIIIINIFIYTFIKDRKLFFPVAWIVISYLPVNLRIFGKFDYAINDRYLYIPSFGFFLLFSIISYRLSNKKISRIVFYAIHIFIIILLAISTVMRVLIWQSNFSLWADTLKKAPDYDLPHLCMALEYDKRNIRTEAIKEYKQTIAINPGYQIAYVNLAANLYIEKLYDEAIYYTKEALKLDPACKKSEELLRKLYREKLKELAGSEEGLKAIDIQTIDYLKMSEIYMSSGKYDKAEKILEELYHINPWCEEVHLKLALLYKYQGNMEKYRLILLKISEHFPHINKDIQNMIKEK